MNAPARKQRASLPIIDAPMVERLAQKKEPELEKQLIVLAREGNLKGVVSKPPRFSATTIQWHDDCERKFYWPAVAGLEDPPSPAQADGTALHLIQEVYLKTGKLPPSTKLGELAMKGHSWLPQPMSPGLGVEAPFNLDVDIPGVTLTGTIDFTRDPMTPEGKPDFNAKGFLLGDHKTARSARYPKSKAWLHENIQSNVYSYARMLELQARGFKSLNVVDKQWIYYFKEEHIVDRLRLVQSVDDVREQFETRIIPNLQGMARMVREAPRIGDVPKADKSVCEMYRGCPHLARCFGHGNTEERGMGAGATRFGKTAVSERIENLTGQIFGRYTVVAIDTSRPAGNGVHARWLVRCDCGQERSVDSNTLKRGDTRSCGCLKAETDGQHSVTHGMTSAPEYGVWKAMLNRCKSDKNKGFKNYGGRGIRVAEAWEKFEVFYADMGPRPSDEHTIDRIDNEGNYEPGNCRWATWTEQARNRRPRTLRREVLGALHGNFSKANIQNKASNIAPRGAGAAINPPRPAPVKAAPKPVVAEVFTDDEGNLILEDGTPCDEQGNPIDTGEVETQPEEPAPTPPPARKPRATKKNAAAQPVSVDNGETATVQRSNKGTRTQPGYNSAHDFWLFVDCAPSKGFGSLPVFADVLVGPAQTSAAMATGSDHYRQGQSYGALEAAFAQWMEENAIGGSVIINQGTIVSRDVLGLLKAHASVVVERVQ